MATATKAMMLLAPDQPPVHHRRRRSFSSRLKSLGSSLSNIHIHPNSSSSPSSSSTFSGNDTDIDDSPFYCTAASAFDPSNNPSTRKAQLRPRIYTSQHFSRPSSNSGSGSAPAGNRSSGSSFLPGALLEGRQLHQHAPGAEGWAQIRSYVTSWLGVKSRLSGMFSVRNSTDIPAIAVDDRTSSDGDVSPRTAGSPLRSKGADVDERDCYVVAIFDGKYTVWEWRAAIEQLLEVYVMTCERGEEFSVVAGNTEGPVCTYDLAKREKTDRFVRLLEGRVLPCP